LLLALATALVASIEPTVAERLRLGWTAPPGCPTVADLRAAIDRNLAGEAIDGPWESIEVDGRIEPSGAGWELNVRVALPDGRLERALASDTCDELADAAGLVIAVALDPLRDPSTPPAAALGPVASRPAVDREAAPRLGPDDDAKPRPAARWTRPPIDLRLGVLGELGSLGTPRVGGWFGIGVVGRRARLDLAGQYWAPRRLHPFDGAPSAGVALAQGGVSIRGCFIALRGTLSLATCVGAEAGAARGRGIGLARVHASWAPWAAVVLGPELSWISRRRVGLWVAADAMVHVVRPRWIVRDLGIGARTGPVGVRLVAGPSVRL
jgi:hypothetical protein